MEDEEVDAKLARMRQLFGRKVESNLRRDENQKLMVEEPTQTAPEPPNKKRSPDVPEPDNDVEEEQENGSYTVVHVEIVSEILQHYASPLLTQSERATLTAFLELGDKSQKLFVRLLGRKYRVFRCSSLQKDAEEALLELQAQGFLSLVGGGLGFAGSKHRAMAF